MKIEISTIKCTIKSGDMTEGFIISTQAVDVDDSGIKSIASHISKEVEFHINRCFSNFKRRDAKKE